MTFDPDRSAQFPLQRRPLVARLLADPGELLVVSGLGAPTWDVTAAGDGGHCFPLWGAMGGAVMVGLGLALAQPTRRVLVVTGDGEILMGLGSLAVVAAKSPANLAIAVLDNERYGETGMQSTHTAGATDLATAARGLGIAQASTIAAEPEVDGAIEALRRDPGPIMVVFKVRAEDLPLVLPPKDGAFLKQRFRQALLGQDTK